MSTPGKLNGCHNREPLKSGYWVIGFKGKHFIEHRMTTECQYSRDPMGLGQKDPGCAGCKWKAGEQK